jgi:hypothetical protein
MTASFLHADDYIILMIPAFSDQYWSLDMLRSVQEVGVKTVMRYVVWKDIETAPGEYHWDIMHQRIEEDRQAGLKTIVNVYTSAPAFFPEEFYVHAAVGGLRLTWWAYPNLLTSWGPGYEVHLGFLKRCCEILNSTDVLCMRGTCEGGEVMFPHDPFPAIPNHFNLHKLAVEVMLQEQEIFHASTPYPDLFTQLHHIADRHEQCCTTDTERIYSALREKFPDMIHDNITYSLLPGHPGIGKHLEDMKRFGYRGFVGSEYCQHLVEHTPRAMELGFAGFLTAPIHPFLLPGTTLEPWMVQALSESIGQWRAAALARETHHD